MAPLRRMIDAFLEGSLIMGDTLGAAPESKLLAQVITSLGTDCAATAGHPNFERDPVANLESRNLGPNRNHNTRGLVA